MGFVFGETVGKWRSSDSDVERVLSLTLESTPSDATHWSTRSLTKVSGLRRASVHRTRKGFALRPHRTETFELSKNRYSSTSFGILLVYIWILLTVHCFVR